MSPTEVTSPRRNADQKNVSSPRTIDGLLIQFPFGSAFGDLLEAMLHDDMQSAQLSKVFQLFYRLRPFLPIAIRQLLQRAKNGSQKSDEQTFQPQRLLDWLARHDHTPQSMWPNQSEYALVLTHDVETKQGVKLIEPIAELEEQLGFRSSWNIVPYKYKTDKGLIRSLKDRGHEIGVHGYNHDGRLFVNQKTFEARVPAINRAIQDLEAVGFRAPMVHRNLHWLQQLDIKYDASCFDIDPFQAMPGGVGSLWPFQCGKFVELPYTMPQDHTLFVTLGETTDAVWRAKLETIRRYHGMALMLTHPDYLDSPSLREIYRGFLQYLRDETRPWHALPRKVAETYRV